MAAASDLETVVFAEPSFRKLSPMERNNILACATRKVLPAGTAIYRRDDQPNGIYVVLKGLVRVTGVSHQGDEFILDLCGRGVWIGEIAVLEERARTHDAITETRAELLHFTIADIEQLLSTSKGFARSLLRLEAKRFRQAADWAEYNATTSLQAMMAFRLKLLATRDPFYDARRQAFELKLTQLTLSRLVGSTRQRVNQVLQEWQKQKIVKASRGSLVILDIAKLETRITEA